MAGCGAGSVHTVVMVDFHGVLVSLGQVKISRTQKRVYLRSDASLPTSRSGFQVSCNNTSQSGLFRRKIEEYYPAILITVAMLGIRLIKKRVVPEKSYVISS